MNHLSSRILDLSKSSTLETWAKPSVSISLLSLALVLLLVSSKAQPIVRLFKDHSSSFFSFSRNRTSKSSKSTKSFIDSTKKTLFPSTSAPKTLNPDSKTIVSCSTDDNFNIHQFQNPHTGSLDDWNLSFQLSTNVSNMPVIFNSGQGLALPQTHNFALLPQYNQKQFLTKPPNFIIQTAPTQKPYVDTSPYSIYSSPESQTTNQVVARSQLSNSYSDGFSLVDLTLPNSNDSDSLANLSSSPESLVTSNLNHMNYNSILSCAEIPIPTIPNNPELRSSAINNLGNNSNIPANNNNVDSVSSTTFLDIDAFGNFQCKPSADELFANVASSDLSSLLDFNPNDIELDGNYILNNQPNNKRSIPVSRLPPQHDSTGFMALNSHNLKIPQFQTSSVMQNQTHTQPHSTQLQLSSYQPQQYPHQLQQKLPQPRYNMPVQMLPNTVTYSVPMFDQNQSQNDAKCLYDGNLNVISDLMSSPEHESSLSECSSSPIDETSLANINTNVKNKPRIIMSHGQPIVESTGRIHGRSVLARGLPFACPHCSASFRIRGYLTRHIKKHAVNKAYTCPFFECGEETPCHSTGGFSRRDTYKTHLKARHFVYPTGTRSENRAKVGGRCRGCGESFDSNETWVEEHIHKKQCRGLRRYNQS